MICHPFLQKNFHEFFSQWETFAVFKSLLESVGCCEQNRKPQKKILNRNIFKLKIENKFGYPSYFTKSIKK